MVLEEKQKRAILGLEKTGIINLNYRWPNATVPYVLADGYFTQGQVEQIERGLRASKVSVAFGSFIGPMNRIMLKLL